MSTHVGHGARPVVPPTTLVQAFDDVESEWDALATNGAGVFATALWQRSWWTHFGAGRELLVHTTRAADGELRAVVPLYAWRRRHPRILRFLGHGPGDELGPVAVDPATAASSLLAALDGLEWDVFVGEQLSGGHHWTSALDAHPWRREAAPVLRLPATWDEYLDGRSTNFRQQLRRRERAVSTHGLSFRLAHADTLERDLDALFTLHRARWGDTRTDFADSSFHRDVARAAAERGWLRLWLLEEDGRAVAAWHGFQVGPVTSYYQAGRDPAHERLAVGHVLLAHSIREAIGEGAGEYRFGRGDEAFKLRFTGDDPGLQSVLRTRGLFGRASYVGARAARRARAAGRRARGRLQARRAPE